MAQVYHCKVCGLPVNPAEGIAFGHAGKVWFAAHRGKCEETVRKGRDGLFQAAAGLLAVKAPRAYALLEAVTTAMKKQREQNP